MTAVPVVVGLVLIAVALSDIFHTLWHPRGFGTLSRRLFKMVWGTANRVPERLGLGELAGPLGLVITAVVWTALLVLGFALVYLPFLPEGFNYSSSLEIKESSGFLASTYVSLVALATLGLGDIVPASGPLRLVVPLQTLLGFVLLTAAISWVLQLYPALARRRALARTLSGLATVGAARRIPQLEPVVVVPLLDGVRTALGQVEMDLLQNGESYYFRDSQRDISLAAVLPYAGSLISAARHNGAAECALAADLLEEALHHFTDMLAGEFSLGRSGEIGVLGAFAADHGQRPLEVD